MIGENIKRLMKENGYTQKQLAIRSQCSVSAISRYIHNKREPSFEAIKRLSISLGIKADELFKDNQKPKKTNFDRINNMTIEEAAHELTELFYKVAQNSNAEHYIRNWLQKEADDGI